MELKIENGIFFVLEAEDDKRLYTTESEAIVALKQITAANKDLNPEHVNIIEVNTEGEQWKMTAISWAAIAMELLRNG